MAYDPNLFNVDPYYDDYDDNKKFLRVLYKPGYAVQARELTQAQTISQKQIQRFGDHVFKDGSAVTESQVTTVSGKYIRVSGLTGYSGVSEEDFTGLTAVVSGKNTILINSVLSGLSGSDKDTASIFFFSEYLAGPTGFSIGDVISSNFDGVTISATVTGGTSTYNSYSGAPNSLPSSGDATMVGVDKGVRYIKGYFVNHDSQKVLVYNITGSSPSTYRKFNNLSSSVVFDVTDSIISSTDDDSLNDPAYGSFNYAAPGADRYRIDLTLNHYPFGVTSNYILANIENDLVLYKSNNPQYNILADELARRTYDESGNYTVEPFQIFVEDLTSDAQEGNLKIKIGPGKAYVYGYEFVNPVAKNLTASKARDYVSTNINLETQVIIGNSLSVTKNTSLTANIYDKINWNGSPLFYISSATGSTAFSKIGSLRIGKYDAIESPSNIHVYDVRLDSGFTPSAAKRIFYPGYTGDSNYLFEINSLDVTETKYDSLVFPLSNDISSYAVREIQNHSYTIQRSKKIDLSSGVGNIYMTDFASGTEFDSGSNFEFVSKNDVKFYSPTGSALTSYDVTKVSNTSLTFGGPPGATNSVVFVSITVNDTGSDAYVRTKSSVTKNASLVITGNSFEKFAYFNGDVDVYNCIAATGFIGGVTSDILNYFTFDDGQKNSIYDWSRLVLKKEYYGSGITSVDVRYQQYSRENSCLPYMLRSYGDTNSLGLQTGGTGSDYKRIPFFVSDGQSPFSLSLAGCLDARPDRITPASFSITSSPENYGATGGCHLIEPSFETKWTYFLPRTDRLYLTREKQFKTVSGTPSEVPLPPQELNNAMPLATIHYLPYTETRFDTKIIIEKNQRYTMRDIGELDQRLDKVEYYTTLSSLEVDAKNLEIQDANGLNKYKNGIFADNFLSHQKANSTHPDYSCAIDQVLGEARPKFKTKYVDFSLTGSIPAGLTYAASGIALCNYTTEIFINQSLASKAINTNPFNVVVFLGHITLNPLTDDWVDTVTRPDLIINIDTANSSLEDGQTLETGTIWNDWETTWTGTPTGIGNWKSVEVVAADIVYRNSSGTITGFKNKASQQDIDRLRAAGYQVSFKRGSKVHGIEAQIQVSMDARRARTGTKTSITPTTTTQRLGNRLVDLSVIPYMRSINIDFKAEGMRPNVRFYPFFDDTDVSNRILINGVTSAAPLITDSAGRLGFTDTLTFNVPSGTFRTGQRIFRLTDDPNNVIANSSSNADATFTSSGLLRVEQGEVVSTRSLITNRETVRDEEVFNLISRATRKYTRQVDPVSQTFFIDPIENPKGIFIKKIDLYFKSKDPTLPLFFQLRPVINGYPSSSDVIPFSQVTLLPSDVNISDDGSVPTTVTFENPIYLQPAEYAIVLLGSSTKYDVWVSEVGSTDTITGAVISTQPILGSFFKSQNSGTWTAEQLLDLKFRIHKCVFNTAGGTLQFEYNETDFSTDGTGVVNGANIFKLNSTNMLPPGTDMDYSVTFEVDGIEVPCSNNENLIFSQKKSISNASEDTITAKVNFSTSDSNVSPILDLQRMSGLYIQNLINYFVNETQQETREKLPSVGGFTASDVGLMRYLTPRVVLQDNFESNDIDVFLSAKLPAFSSIKVYMRSQARFDGTSFFNVPFEQLQVHPDYINRLNDNFQYVSVNDNDYVDLRFIRGATGTTGDRITSGITGVDEFKNFQIKVVMYGDADNSTVPAFRNFRTIAT